METVETVETPLDPPLTQKAILVDPHCLPVQISEIIHPSGVPFNAHRYSHEYH